ncbi:MauE/DoxX family redox-associated membrane protein [Chitinophaga sancti]|uniref:MauE/DoxX family redox-associated membrane protein n=1 Tax=Chitinophaga sancti TaxID=1004 RepID=A0A1K1PYX3_9BACT|nr:MauE/DoxX family redox-associated membrane protein [Chitinophaga sancti]WQD61498.1 MauE/DoxX family redox-associated membrane protein [Chitinophaga sancti]WQG92945.1 MauE/DoxX family redox-associated membrane protein [Chitinophaga sancti]SFW52651.1 Methylamine utilisation protein MauE [Chitinophaga sancti]
MKKKLLIEIIASLLIILFLYTGITKLIEHATFRYQLSISPWSLLASWSGIVSWVLPIGEVLLAAMLLITACRKTAFIASAILFAGFLVYLGMLLGSGTKLPCTCGGIISSMSWNAHVWFDAACLLLCMTGIWLVHNTYRILNQH